MTNLPPQTSRIQRVLITGGAGFIGAHTVNLLLSKDKEVVVLDNLFSGKLNRLDLTNPNLEFIEGDILEYPLVEELLLNCDAVLHLAAIASVQLSIENPLYTAQVNTQGFLHILQAVHQANRPIRLVFASSAAVYGSSQALPLQEDIASLPLSLSPYALQKVQCEQYADLFSRLHQLPSLGLRYFNVYGPGQDPHSPYAGVISKFIAAYQNNETLTIFGDGNQSRDFIHVNDIAYANLLALENQYSGVLNIATGKPQTLVQLIKSIEIAGGEKPATIQFEPARAGDIVASYGATQLAETQLGFHYSTPLTEGIKDLLNSPSLSS